MARVDSVHDGAPRYRRPVAATVHRIDAGAEHDRRRSRQRDRRQPAAVRLRHAGRHADRHPRGRLSRRIRPEEPAREHDPLHQRHPAVGAVDRDRPVRVCDRRREVRALLGLGRRDRARAAADSDRDPHDREHAEAGAERAARSSGRARHAEVAHGDEDHAARLGGRDRDRRAARGRADRRRDRAAAVHRAVEPVLLVGHEPADGQPARHDLQVRDEPVRGMAIARVGGRVPDYARCARTQHPGALDLLEKVTAERSDEYGRKPPESRRAHGCARRHARHGKRPPARAVEREDRGQQPQFLLQQVPRAEEHQPAHSRREGHGVHRPVGLRQVDAAAHLQQDVRALSGAARRRRDPDGRREPADHQARHFAAACAHRHGVPEADAVPDVDLRQHRVRREDVREAHALGDGRPRRMGADQSRAVERSQGQAEPERLRAVRRPAAAAVHRARHRDPSGSAAARRAVLRARPDLDGPHRGADRRAQERLHGRDRHAQHAAGRTLLGLHRVHVPGRADRIRRDREDLHQAGTQGNGRLHHRPFRLMTENNSHVG
ncbi:hypothetical protein BVI1335_1140028 [Burkholderia vietnamiensis]|nr:hypothetical protein BVI1335_1140028 [Burkholderia vietnamiensis]